MDQGAPRARPVYGRRWLREAESDEGSWARVNQAAAPLIRHAFGATPSPTSGRRESRFNYFNPRLTCVMMLS